MRLKTNVLPARMDISQMLQDFPDAKLVLLEQTLLSIQTTVILESHLAAHVH
jgi:hypothetical protein